ncbi:MAG: prolipoprotein diacylglyceryl transferase [Actinomycetaceae bacterium]|nr:prolipoprotein diacylglyceryl transferase [Actinomycetaceae bacterium]
MSIPSPPQGVWHIGIIPVRAYALAILTGMFVAIYVGRKRYAARGGDPEVVLDVAVWAIPVGIVGARLYHVITDYQLYFGPGKHPLDALKIWNGGLGIWGGVIAGALTCAIVLRRRGLTVAPFADALAPGVIFAQAIGRLGNWFNQELFGSPTTLPWGLQIDAAHTPSQFPVGTLFHPTFLYELVWCVCAGCFLLWWDKKYLIKGGQLFALYVFVYALGRIWVENLRIDPAHIIWGLRLNVWTTLAGAVLAILIYWWLGRGDQSSFVQAHECDNNSQRNSSWMKASSQNV